jgi:translation initiation factor 3 subunit I
MTKQEYAMDIISLQHTQPITDLKYNREGDILFTSDKSREKGNVNAWWSHNGERIGTYNGHTGAVYSVDVDSETTRLITGGADSTVRLWNVNNGRQIKVWQKEVTVYDTRFSFGDQRILVLTANQRNRNSAIEIHTCPEDVDNSEMLVRTESETRDDQITTVVWGYLNEHFLSGHSDGSISLFDTETGTIVRRDKFHTSPIPTIKSDNYGLSIITSSKNGVSKLIDTRTMDVIQTYDVGRPINCAAISPKMEHVILGGGESADKVTLSSATSKSFTIRFYHAIYGEEMGSVHGHFGPVNTLSFNPTGRSFASGGEDGQVVIRHFPSSYINRTYDERENTRKRYMEFLERGEE